MQFFKGHDPTQQQVNPVKHCLEPQPPARDRTQHFSKLEKVITLFMWQQVKHQVDGSGQENIQIFTFSCQACRVLRQRQKSPSCCIYFPIASILKSAYNPATRASKSVCSLKMSQNYTSPGYIGTGDNCNGFHFHLPKLQWVFSIKKYDDNL